MDSCFRRNDGSEVTSNALPGRSVAGLGKAPDLAYNGANDPSTGTAGVFQPLEDCIMPDAFDLTTFIPALASGEPTPGGGSAAALAGALGAALAAMVSRLTVGRPKYAAVDAQMQRAIVDADTLRSRLLQLVDEDAAAYDQVRAAYRLPKDTPEQQAVRAVTVQQALQGATRTPLATVDACLAVMRLAEQVVTSGNPNASTDGAVGALLAHAGLRGAALNVRINLGGIDDPAFVAASQSAVTSALAEADRVLGRIMGLADG
jgi:formiminotetrahydrofolate cyclodeaminase